jgi:putrescine transport system substrate-binding protein
MEKVSAQDPDNAHGIVYFWGTNGVGYNEAMIKRLMPNAPLDSWRLIFDPAVASKIAKCGIGVVDSPTDLMRAVLPYLGRDPNSQKAEDLAAADDAAGHRGPLKFYAYPQCQYCRAANSI